MEGGGGALGSQSLGAVLPGNGGLQEFGAVFPEYVAVFPGFGVIAKFALVPGRTRPPLSTV